MTTDFREKLIGYGLLSLMIGVPALLCAMLIYFIFDAGLSSIVLLRDSQMAPFQKETVAITSKDSQQVLSFKSDKLPKKGDRITADQYTYGAISVGDKICVQYKSIPDDAQFGIEFVNEGICK